LLACTRMQSRNPASAESARTQHSQVALLRQDSNVPFSPK
jgi:hypothetical protein